MSEFSSFVAKAKELSELLSEKTAKYAEIAKIKVKIIDTQSDIEILYKKLGKSIYNASNNNGTASEIESDISQINEKRKKLAELQEKLAELKNIKRCDSCGFEASSSGEYCPKCGSKI